MVILEDLDSNQELQEMLFDITGGSRRFDDIIYKNRTNEKRFRTDELNQYVPPTQKELDRLYHLNRLDIELYEYAKELSNYTITNYMNRKYQRKSEHQQQHRE